MDDGPSAARRSSSIETIAVTLDANGVLLVPDPSIIRGALGSFSVQPDDETCWRSHAEVVALLDEMAQEPDYVELGMSFARALGVPPEAVAAAGPAATAAVLSDHWIAAPGAAEAVMALQEAGIRLAVISNTTHGQMSKLLTKVRVCNYGGAPDVPVFDSGVFGIRKPDSAIFEAALHALDVGANWAIHVGDSRLDDIDGASAIGMTAVHIDPLRRCLDTAHAHAPSLSAWTRQFLR